MHHAAIFLRGEHYEATRLHSGLELRCFTEPGGLQIGAILLPPEAARLLRDELPQLYPRESDAEPTNG